MQSLDRNALANPYILGISSGTSVGAVAVSLVGAFSLLDIFAVSTGVFLGTIGLAALVYAITSTGGSVTWMDWQPCWIWSERRLHTSLLVPYPKLVRLCSPIAQLPNQPPLRTYIAQLLTRSWPEFYVQSVIDTHLSQALLGHRVGAHANAIIAGSDPINP